MQACVFVCIIYVCMCTCIPVCLYASCICGCLKKPEKGSRTPESPSTRALRTECTSSEKAWVQDGSQLWIGLVYGHLCRLSPMLTLMATCFIELCVHTASQKKPATQLIKATISSFCWWLPVGFGWPCGHSDSILSTHTLHLHTQAHWKQCRLADTCGVFCLLTLPLASSDVQIQSRQWRFVAWHAPSSFLLQKQWPSPPMSWKLFWSLVS